MYLRLEHWNITLLHYELVHSIQLTEINNNHNMGQWFDSVNFCYWNVGMNEPREIETDTFAFEGGNDLLGTRSSIFFFSFKWIDSLKHCVCVLCNSCVAIIFYLKVTNSKKCVWVIKNDSLLLRFCGFSAVVFKRKRKKERKKKLLPR